MSRRDANTTVDGRPAPLRPTRSELTVYEVRGVEVTVTVHPGDSTAPADPRAGYAELEIPPVPNHPGQWTTPLS